MWAGTVLRGVTVAGRSLPVKLYPGQISGLKSVSATKEIGKFSDTAMHTTIEVHFLAVFGGCILASIEES
jgi:hypothetical protein